jgi:hypothetical protein
MPALRNGELRRTLTFHEALTPSRTLEAYLLSTIAQQGVET